jgi:Spy/CpxP family protein refolding chaperone
VALLKIWQKPECGQKVTRKRRFATPVALGTVFMLPNLAWALICDDTTVQQARKSKKQKSKQKQASSVLSVTRSEWTQLEDLTETGKVYPQHAQDRETLNALKAAEARLLEVKRELGL